MMLKSDVIKIENNVISGYSTGKVGAPYPSGFQKKEGVLCILN